MSKICYNTCPNCGQYMYEHSCFAICPRCGVAFDCNDMFNYDEVLVSASDAVTAIPANNACEIRHFDGKA